MLRSLARFVQSHYVITEVGSTCSCHDLNPAHVFADLDADLTHLESQFSSGHNDHRCKTHKR